jgi:hypothetical protein
MKKLITLEIICFLFTLLFMYAAASKLLDYQQFSIEIGQSPLLTGLGGFVPWLVITIELIVSVLLLVPKFRLLGLYGAFCLMVMFTAYIIAILNFSTYIPCSCGGILAKLGWKEHLIFNVAFLVLSLVAIMLHDPEEDLANIAAKQKSTPDKPLEYIHK